MDEPFDLKTRELSNIEIIVMSFKIFFTNIKYTLPICLAVYIPLNIMLMLIPSQWREGLFASFQTMDSLNMAMRYLGVLMLLEVVFSPLAAGALSYVTVQNIENKGITFAGIMETSLVKWGKLVYTSLLYYTIFSLSLIFIVPAFYFLVVFMFYQCIAAISNKYGVSALVISRVLMKGKWLKGIGLLALTFLISYIIDIFFGNLLMLSNTNNYVVVFLINVFLNVIGSFKLVAVCVFYINVHYTFLYKEKKMND